MWPFKNKNIDTVEVLRKKLEDAQEVILTMGATSKVLTDELLLEKEACQILLGALLIQKGDTIKVENKFIDDMKEDQRMYVTVTKGESLTTITLERLS